MNAATRRLLDDRRGERETVSTHLATHNISITLDRYGHLAGLGGADLLGAYLTAGMPKRRTGASWRRIGACFA